MCRLLAALCAALAFTLVSVDGALDARTAGGAAVAADPSPTPSPAPTPTNGSTVGGGPPHA